MADKVFLKEVERQLHYYEGGIDNEKERQHRC